MKIEIRLLLVAMVLTLCVGCDQASKDIAQESLQFGPLQSMMNDSVRLLYVENPGITFGLGADLPATVRFWLFTVGGFTLLMVFLLFILLNREVRLVEIAGAALIVGGGTSNLLDRLQNNGSVIDFIIVNVGVLRSFVFNFADIAILTGCFLMLVGIGIRAREMGLAGVLEQEVAAVPAREDRIGS